MKVSVRVQPRSSREEVLRNADGSLKVYLRTAPADGKANKSLVEILAGYFGVSKSSVRIITGLTGRNKIIEIIK